MFLYWKVLFINSFRSLRAEKKRSFLTMLGIIIGVAAVIVIMSIGAGAQGLILSQVKSLGSNLVGIMPGKSDDNGPPASVMGVVITTLTYDDALALKNERNTPNVLAIAAYAQGVSTVSWRENSYDTNLSGCNSEYLEVEGGEVESGRFFGKDDEKSLARVIIIGETVKNELFNQSNPVGQIIRIKNQSFEVIGVMKKRGVIAFQDYDDKIFLPITTMQKLILGVNHVGLIRAKIDKEENIDKAMADIALTLRERHNIDDKTGSSDDFTVRSALQAVDMLKTITDALSYFLTAMAAMSLIVGGIGIMNIMLIRVAERTREIGLRKALGATKKHIMSQFLVEAISITLSGGFIGVFIGELVSWLIAVVAQQLKYDWVFSLSIIPILLALSVSIAIGLIFGIYPASKAAKMNPIEALRYE